MSLQTQTTRVAPDIVVVHLSGRITSSEEGRVIEPLFSDLLNQNEKKLIFDLSGVEEINSTGINIVIDCFLAARKAGAGFRLVSASARVARLFKITRLDTVFSCYRSVAAACQGFTIPPEMSD